MWAKGLKVKIILRILCSINTGSSNWSAVVVELLNHVWLFETPWMAARQASLSLTISWSLLRLMSLNWWCHPTISSSVVPFSPSLQSFPASGSFPMSGLFTSDGQSVGASASVLPMNMQGRFPLGLTDLISLLSKRLSRVFSNIKLQKHQFCSALILFYDPTLTSVRDYWKNHRLDYMDLCCQNDVSDF